MITVMAPMLMGLICLLLVRVPGMLMHAINQSRHWALAFAMQMQMQAASLRRWCCNCAASLGRQGKKQVPARSTARLQGLQL